MVTLDKQTYQIPANSNKILPTTSEGISGECSLKLQSDVILSLLPGQSNISDFAMIYLKQRIKTKNTSKYIHTDLLKTLSLRLLRDVTFPSLPGSLDVFSITVAIFN